MIDWIGGALVLLGVVAALIGAFAWRRARQQLGWEAVQGTVLSAKILRDWEYYEPRIEYTYSYHGREFRGAKVRSPIVLVNWRGPARRLVEKYPLGSAVTVFVNPENPGESVLERGGDRKFLPLMLAVSSFFLLMGWLALNQS